ncbi:MAG: octaprenyl diphosphate synthase [Nitrospirales bacterium]|nr:MAG: octaprenyl diphosphate synthase [Nitrospirales bacterium]
MSGNSPTLQNLTNMADVWDAHREELNEVELQVHKNLNSEASLINTISSQIMASGGKRIRPLLLILSAKLCGFIQREYLLLGSLIEYIHTATLLHDDVLDEADIRRGEKTARRIWGNHASILVGDYLYSQAMTQIASFHNHGFNESLADACRKMTEGEVLQLCANSRPEITEPEYLQIVEYKTATLVAASCKIGAAIGEGTPAEQAALARFGLNLGMAFQLTDDCLDYLADGARLGKTLGKDIRQGMVTLPLLHLFQTCEDDQRQWIKSKVQSRAITDEDLTTIINLMHEHHSLTYATQKAEEYVMAASLDLEPFADGMAKRSLAIVSQYMVNRDQ